VVERAVEVCSEIVRWKADPFKCLYHNPSKYDIVKFAVWAEKYCNYKVFKALLKASEITGFEPVPSELLHKHVKRDGYSGRGIRIGNAAFYLIRYDEMSPGLKKRYGKFREMFKEIGNELGVMV